jgi:phosphatidylinositol-3-phosphatase
MKHHFIALILLVLFSCKGADAPEPVIYKGGMPQFDKIVVVIGENTLATSVFGNTTDAPFINSLAQKGAAFTESYAIEHPSQPNYFDLFSGSNQGITHNNMPTQHFTTPNLGAELFAAGKKYCSYSEDLPYVGFDSAQYGLYVRRHNPTPNWTGTGLNQIPDSTNKPFTDFPVDYSLLPDVSFVIPNLCSDGHDVCMPLSNRTKQFDEWVQDNLSSYANWCKTHNSLLIVTYDEDDFTNANKIATVFYGAHVKSGSFSKMINHFNVLRTIEDLMGLTTHAGQAADAFTINYCWTERDK